MRKLAGILLVVIFVLSFGAGCLLSTDSAEAGCLKKCSFINCVPEKVCVCGGNPYCCGCVPRP
jgi:hypothetical protein